MGSKSTLKNMLLCLTAVCLICSAVLAVAYSITKEPIAQAEIAKTNSSIAQVLPAFEGDAQMAEIEFNGTKYTYYKTSSAGCAIISEVSGFGGPLTLMVGITAEGIVHNVVVLSHNETPGLGAKCRDDQNFISQFRQLNPSDKNLLVRKDGGDIDAITASTITSRAYTLAVKNAVSVFQAIGGQENE